MMARYIDVDAFLVKAQQVLDENSDKCYEDTVSREAIETIIWALKKAPTADVAPVKHAEWIMEQREGREVVAMMPKTIETWYVCSVCGRAERKKEPYCNCGAKMEGKSNL